MLDHDDDIPTNPTDTPTFADVLKARLSRRGFMGTALAGAAAAMAASPIAIAEALAAGSSTLNFSEIAHGIGKDHTVAKDYVAHAFLRWGDPILAGAPKFDPMRQTPAAQAMQFGYNNDFVAYMPLPLGTNDSENGLLCVNHEYTEGYMMFGGLNRGDVPEKQTKEQSDIELGAHGASIVEIRKTSGRWKMVENSKFNRRITAMSEIRISGPAAGHDRLKTKADPSGTKVMGTLNNCAGGKTPWGTILTCEENFNNYFAGDIAKTKEESNYKRLGFSAKSRYPFARFDDRFNVEKEPNEGNRFGWVVEIDPYDPLFVPVKRTALGRFKHEGATTWVNPDGTVTIYSGDDQANDYLYKFVTKGKFDPINRAANMNLLDDGTLYAAKFKDDGTVTWLPLVFGAQWLTKDNGFNSQADISIETRRAADLVGATPMDRPEDVEVNPVTGRAYVVLTNNTARTADKRDKANPRANNRYGQILELIVTGEGKAANHAALEHKWEMFLMAGPANEGGVYGAGTSENGWLACPDNIAFDNRGRMWIASDQGTEQPKFGIGDGIWAADTTGAGRAVTRFFYRTPTGAEMCGPEFTPDNKTMFVAVQHPAADDDPKSTYDNPSTRWPDFKPNMPPRPAIVAITKKGGGVIGS
jgi:secreted PhoX family phosphatase